MGNIKVVISDKTRRELPIAAALADAYPWNSNWYTHDQHNPAHSTADELNFLDDLPHQVLMHYQKFGSIINIIKCYETYLNHIFTRLFDYYIDREACADRAKKRLQFCNVFRNLGNG